MSINFPIELTTLLDRELFLGRPTRSTHGDAGILDYIARVGVAILVALLPRGSRLVRLAPS